ncbi:transcriptional regulator [Caballeronia catudaia]|uniref:Transcriptional regulator n=1 Tax=Caballeronia catudaia TaxID=1777136 RepID=A0A158B5T9_9BURK|nr:transcriptional regulator [Caballeronia catudaia]
MMAFSSVTEPLRAANRVGGKEPYSWHLISADGEPVSSSSGFALLPDFAITSSPELSHVFVVASIGVRPDRNAPRAIRVEASSRSIPHRPR